MEVGAAGAEFARRAGVAENEVGCGLEFTRGALGAHAPFDGGAGRPVAGGDAAEPFGAGRGDDEEEVEHAGDAGLEDEGRFDDGDPPAAADAAQVRAEGADDGGMDDAVEGAEFPRVAEDDGGERRAVDGAVRGDHAVAERAAEGAADGRVALHDRAGDEVGGEDERAAAAEVRGHRALTAADTACETDDEHR